jgi:hypothetical protein
MREPSTTSTWRSLVGRTRSPDPFDLGTWPASIWTVVASNPPARVTLAARSRHVPFAPSSPASRSSPPAAPSPLAYGVPTPKPSLSRTPSSPSLRQAIEAESGRTRPSSSPIGARAAGANEEAAALCLSAVSSTARRRPAGLLLHHGALFSTSPPVAFPLGSSAGGAQSPSTKRGVTARLHKIWVGTASGCLFRWSTHLR